MTDIQAALGIHQLARLEDNLKLRQHYWQLYNEAFADVSEIVTPAEIPDASGPARTRHARHLYTILLDLDRLAISRWEFMERMKAENIGTGIHYVALHLSSFYQQNFGYRRGDFPNAESLSDRTVSLPLSPAMTEQDLTDVVEAVKRVIDAGRKRLGQ